MKRTILAVMVCCMAGLGLRAQTCDTIGSFPWEADFSGGLGCWQQSGNGYWTAANSQAIYGQLNSGVTSTGYITITTPVLQFGNSTTGLRLWWKDQRNYMYPNLRVMVLKENGTRDTLYTADMGTTLTQHSVSLAAYTNQTVRIAFEVRLSAGGYSYRGTLSQIGIYTQYGPLGTLSVPKVAAVGDSVRAVLNLTRGQAPISYSWHSTMLGGLAGGDTLQLVYPMAGWDTLTITASNSYDTLIRTAAVRVHDCQAVTVFPWREDFDGLDTATYNACWTISGWQHLSNGSYMSIVDEEGVTTRYTQLMTPSNSTNGKYMLSPAISIPYADYEHLRLWVQCRRMPAIRISPTASLDTADYTDTLCTGANTTVMEWHLFDLSAYAGQTIRVGLFRDGYQANINCVRVDYDLLPVLEPIDAPDRSRTDSTVTCSIELRRGATDGLVYYWHSSLTGTTWVDNGSSGTSMFNVFYSVGGVDTITVIAANAYGADTAVRVVEVADCSPAFDLPWREDFSYGLGCWYLTENDPYFQWMSNYSGSGNNINWLARSRTSASSTATDAWLVSKAVSIPADTALAVRLFWRVGLSVANNSSVYRVMVSTDADRTDTSAYVELYCDTNLLPGWNNMSQRSVSLAAYAGQTIYIAFRNQPVVRRTASLYIDDVEVRATVAPRVSVAADRNTYYNGDTATFAATIEEGILSGLTYTWHSTLLDSTFAAGDTLRLCYGIWDGWDTVTVVATNAYGADTATIVVRAAYCTAVGIPFDEPFESDSTLACWRKSSYYTAPETGDWSMRLSYDNNHYVIAADTYNSYINAWLVSPAIDIPAGATGVNLNVKVYGGPSTTSTTYLTILASTTGAADTTCFVDTLLHNAYSYDQGWVTETLSLNAYAGQQIHLAFVYTGVSYYSYGIELDSLSIYYQYQPEATLSGGDVMVGDTTRYVATINNCVSTGLTYTWHSSLLDTTWVDSSLARISNLELHYPTAGIDTVTFVAANAYGADTATIVIEVIDCTPALPYTENFERVTATAYNVAGFLPHCWTAAFNGRDTTYTPHVVTTGGYSWISDIPDQALLMLVGIEGGYHAEVILPRFDDSLQNLSIALDYRYENASYGTLEVGYYDDTVFTVVDTLTGYAYNYQRDAVNFASATVPDGQIALRWSAGDWWAVIIDNITVFNTGSDLLLPHVVLDAPTIVSAYDTVTYTAMLQDSSLEGVSITWHSSLLDSTWNAGIMPAAASWELVYPVVGIDTITVTATNSHGSNSDSRVVTVVGLPQVAVTGPTAVSTYDTNSFTANLVAGSTAGLSYTWHSILSGTTIVTTDSIATIVYTISGTDTLTVVATNLLGSDTATLVVNVTYVPLPGSPVVSLQGYAYATLCDTASFEVTLLDGDTTGLTYTWHSAKADRGEATLHPEGSRLKVAYSAINFDTITVVVSNVLGWRSATVTTRVILCEVRDTLPFVATLTEGGSNIYAHFFDWQDERICYPRGSRFRFNWDGWHPEGIGHHSGRNCMVSHGGWLISPPVHLPDSSSDTLAWNATCYYTTYHVLVSPTEYVVNPDGYIDLSYFTDTLYSETGNSMWNRRTVDLSAYAGNTIHFAFVSSGLASDAAHSNGFYVAIDTVRIWEGVNHDTLVGPCPAVTVFPWVDTCEHNNPPCWIYANGDNEWGTHWYCGGTDSGNYFMRSPLPYGYGNTADNWILTPALTLPVATDSFATKLSWRTFTYSSNALYEVRVSPTGVADTAACTDLIYTESGQSDWSERSVWLNQYAGQTIRIAFRNISTGRPGGGFDYMALDDFRVEIVDTMQPPTPDTVWRTVILLCDSAMGSVSGAGVYEDSSAVAISATPYDGFQFLGWSDGDTNASRTLLLVSDTVLTAYFDSISTPPLPPDTVWHSVAVSASPVGSCETYGSGTYVDSSMVEIGYMVMDTAAAGGHWHFLGWNDGPTENPRNILVTSDTAIVALFEWVADSVGIWDVQNSIFEIYPNPAHSDVTVSVGCPATLTMLDLIGRTVIPPTFISTYQHINISTVTPGTYFVRVTTAEGTVVKKLVKE